MIVSHVEFVADFQESFIGPEKALIIQYFVSQPKLVHSFSTLRDNGMAQVVQANYSVSVF